MNVHGTRPRTPGFGPEPKPAADRFSIGTPPQEPFAQERPPDPVTPPAQSTPADPWARYNNEHPTPHNNPPGANRFNHKHWSLSDKKVSKALNLFDNNPTITKDFTADNVEKHEKLLVHQFDL